MEIAEFPWDSLFTLIGVFVGFSLYQVADLIKDSRNKATVKKGLRNELSVAKEILSYAADNENKLPKDRLPIITEMYDASKNRLASILKPKQLIIIQKAYVQIKQTSSPLKGGNTLMRGYLELIGDKVVYQHDLKNEITVLEQAIAELD